MNVGKSHDFRPNQTLGILKKKQKQRPNEAVIMQDLFVHKL